MDLRRFSTLTYSLTSLPSRRHVLTGLTTLGLTLGAARLPGSADAKMAKKNWKRNRNKKSTLCHKGVTIQATKKKKKSLLKKGATPGACASSPPPPPPPPSGCTPSCAANACDMDDGCGGTCGCPVGSICHEGLCRACTVTCDDNSVACTQRLRNAIDAGGTVYVCPGRYIGGIEVLATDVIIVGAGEGDDPATSSILDGNKVVRPLGIRSGRTAAIHRLRVTGANTNSHGGGVRSEGTLMMINCTIAGNVANGRRGGGIYHHEDATGPLTLNACTISDNNAGSGGGIAAFATHPLRLNRCVVSRNMSVTDGGGIELKGALTITDSAISDNEAIEEGGGVYTSGSLSINGASSFTGNAATLSGGGLFVASGAVTLNGTSVKRNRAIIAPGGGIFRQGGAVTLNAVDFSDNSPDDCPGLTC